MEVTANTSGKLRWQQVVAGYQRPDLRRSLWQVVNSIVPYFLLWFLMYHSLKISYWLMLALAVLAAGFMVRIFIIFHDCCHGSFFESRKANNIMGTVTGLLTLTPYYHWRHNHAVHHATSGNLDRRGVGDVWTLTVGEYTALPAWKQLAYRLYRHPVVMFGIGPLFMFLLAHRFARRTDGQRERRSVFWTNLALLGIVVLMVVTIGLHAYAAIQLTILVIGGAAGVWLFYVQHQFDGVRWERHENWDYEASALEGSSFYKLPGILQWFTGNIGFHHIHHLSPRIPNYYLERCHVENPLFQKVIPVTLFSSFKSLALRLWHEESGRLVGFGYLKGLSGEPPAVS